MARFLWIAHFAACCTERFPFYLSQCLERILRTKVTKSQVCQPQSDTSLIRIELLGSSCPASRGLDCRCEFQWTLMSAFQKTSVPGRNTAEVPEDRLDPSGPACAEACETPMPSWKIAENGLSFQCLSRSRVYMSGSPAVEGDLSSIALLRPGIPPSQGSVLLLAPIPAESVGRNFCTN